MFRHLGIPIKVKLRPSEHSEQIAHYTRYFNFSEYPQVGGGHYQYYGVSDNLRSLRRYELAASRILFKWLNRRSQRRSVTWTRFREILAREAPRPRIVHNFYPLYA